MKTFVNTLVWSLIVFVGIADGDRCEAQCINNYATSIEQYGITWYFTESVRCGQFANGDYWVVGPVTITRIEPDIIMDVQTTAETCAHYTH